MPGHCRPIPVETLANRYCDALSMWGQLCCLETMLTARHMPFESEIVEHCKVICLRMMEGAK